MDSDEPSVRVTFVPTVDDHLAAQPLAVLLRGPMRWVAVAGAGVAAVTLVHRYLERGQAGTTDIPAILLMVCMGAGFVVLRFPTYVRKVLRDNPRLQGPVTYDFTARGIRIESSLQTTEVPWTSIVRVRETPQHLLFSVVRGGVNYLVPRRAMRESDEIRLRELLAVHCVPARTTEAKAG